MQRVIVNKKIKNYNEFVPQLLSGRPNLRSEKMHFIARRRNISQFELVQHKTMMLAHCAARSGSHRSSAGLILH